MKNSMHCQFGRCDGKILQRNKDARYYKMMDGKREKVNFIIFYDIDGEETKTVLRLDEYGGEDEGSWVLLEAIEVGEVAAVHEAADEE